MPGTIEPVDDKVLARAECRFQLPVTTSGMDNQTSFDTGLSENGQSLSLFGLNCGHSSHAHDHQKRPEKSCEQ